MLFAVSCGSSTATDDGDGDGDGNGDGTPTETGVTIIGSLTGTSSSISSTPKSASMFKAADGACPNTNNNAVSANLSPSAYSVALKRFVLLGAEGTDDFEVFATTDPESAYIADFVSDTEFFSDPDTYPPAGTYDGILIELFYADATFPLIVPAFGFDEADYDTRNFFYEIEDALPRDVAIEHNGYWNWISREDDWPAVPFTEARPQNVLDLWSDDDFWDRDPLTISTENSSEFGLNFSFDGEPLVVPENPDGLYQIEMAFNVQNTFTYWEYLATDSEEDADGKFTVGEDCGYRIFFPPVTITMTEESAAAE